jgi:Tol biopolymer transport system component/predicted Ser/Thr protein kinase
MTGRTIGRFEILEKLGEGGMGVVWKARDTRLDRFVALKVLPPEKTADAERKRRFVQEAKAASALNHPNIITIYDIDECDGMDFIAMEFVAGKTLDQLIAPKGLPFNEALRYAIQMAGALAAAHATGIIHRDLKPGNIMIAASGDVKILDFGLAKLTERSIGAEDATVTVQGATVAGAVMGTVAYMSPEQAEGRPVDARSDIFSFGCVIYEMLTGQRAFRGILREEPKPVTEIAPNVPQELERIVQRCLRSDAGRRFQNMADLKVALEDLRDESVSTRSASAPPARAQGPPRRRWLFGGALAAIVLAVASGVWWKFGRTQGPPPRLIHFSSLGTENTPAFSPDGNLIAFSWAGPNRDNYDIYVQQIGGGSPLRLTTDPGYDTNPVFSPDGRHIAFTRYGRTVMLVPALGGPERRLCDVKSSEIDYSPDGKTIAVSDRESQTGPVAIYLVSVETGSKTRLTSPPASSLSGDLSPKFSPDGKAIAFERSLAAQLGEVHVVPVAGGESKKLSGDNRGIYGLTWTGDGREVVYSSGRQEMALQLWRVSVSGGAPQPITMAGEDTQSPTISRDARRMAFVRSTQVEGVWRLDLQNDGAAGKVIKVIGSTRIDTSPNLSRDGKRIVFGSNRSGTFEIWVAGPDGSNPVQLTTMGGHAGTPRWSPDGRRVAFDAHIKDNADIYVISGEGGAPRRLTTNPAIESIPAWSADGRWIYFNSDRTGKREIFRVPADGGPETQMTHHGAYEAMESPDGKVLYFLKERSNSPIWKMPSQGGEESPAMESATVLGFNRWQPFDDGIYFVQRTGRSFPPEDKIQFFDFATRKIKTLARMEKPSSGYGGVTVSSDRRQILFAEVDQDDQVIMLVENFR